MNKKNILLKNKIVSGFRKNLFLGILTIMVLCINIYFALLNVTSGSKLSSLEGMEREIAKQNKDIAAELVIATSLASVQRISGELGFVKANEIVYVNANEAVASRLP